MGLNMEKVISNETRDEERAFYGNKNVSYRNITIEGPVDGESAFKENKNINISDSKLALRYPFWHNENGNYKKCSLCDTARAPFWYCKNINLSDVTCLGTKALRECQGVKVENSEFESEEISWKCNNVTVDNSKITSVYAFFGSKDVNINNVKFKGKYSFQYIKNLTISNSELDTKDAFWHSENVLVVDSTVKGEYLGWFSKNITFINCKIIGTQPLCYAKNIKFINCKTEGCDLSFEYSSVYGNIEGDIVSIKNPLKGKLHISGKTEYIVDENAKGKKKSILV